MDINEFFVEEKQHEIKVKGLIFKCKSVTAGDELDWVDDYIETVEIEKDGKKAYVQKANIAKESICKLRNIVEVPFSDEDIKKIYGGNKMRVYREVWEGFAPENDPVSQEERARFVNEQRQKFLQR